MNGYQEEESSPYAQVVNHRTGEQLPSLSPEERIKTVPFKGRNDVPRIYSTVAKRSFTSLDEASLYFNLSSTSIGHHLKGIRNYYGLEWIP